MRTSLTVLAVTLGACFSTATAQHFAGPDGMQNWWDIHCYDDSAACWTQAREQCPRGYAVFDPSPGEGAKPYAVTNASGQTFGTRRVTNGAIVVHCDERAAEREGAIVEEQGKRPPLIDPH